MGRQILLIDDSAMLRRIAASVLHAQPAHYEVIAATRASEGFARACGGEVAVILVDERIAGGADADFCRRLLQEPRTGGVPIVLLTGRNGEDRRFDDQPANVVEFLRKPFSPQQLAGLVNTIAELAKTGASLGEIRLTLHSDSLTATPAPGTEQPPPADEPSVHLAGNPGPSSEPSIRSAMRAIIDESQTGVLRFYPADALPTEVFVDGGHLLLVTTRDGAAYSIGAEEVLPTKISPATLQEGVEEQSRTGIPFLLTLGARGLVSKAAAVDLLHRFGQRQFARLWTLPAKSLRIECERLEALPGFTLRLEPRRETVDEWLLGSLRLLTATDIIAETRHHGFVGTPSFQRRGETILKSLPLNDDEREFIRRINGRNDLPTIAKSMGVAPQDAFLLLHRFRCLEVLDYRPAPPPFMVTPRTNLRRVLPMHR